MEEDMTANGTGEAGEENYEVEAILGKAKDE